jgi:hypothetical protein
VSRYRFIEVEKVNHAVRTLCRVLQVSRTAYYLCTIDWTCVSNTLQPRVRKARRTTRGVARSPKTRTHRSRSRSTL